MEFFLITGGVLAFIALISYVQVYNTVKSYTVKISESDSGIDVALTKRFDVLTKLLSVVKGYAKYEAETLEKVISLRTGMPMGERVQANQAMNDMFSKIQILAENYPELKANENYMMLQKSIVDVEEHLQAARRVYNSNISIYNQYIITFPNNMIAGMMGATVKEFFEAEEAKKKDVEITF